MVVSGDGQELPLREPQVKQLVDAAADAIDWLANMVVQGTRLTKAQVVEARQLAQNLRRYV